MVSIGKRDDERIDCSFECVRAASFMLRFVYINIGLVIGIIMLLIEVGLNGVVAYTTLFEIYAFYFFVIRTLILVNYTSTWFVLLA